MRRRAHTRQPELFPDAATLPAEIGVGPFGISEKWLEEQLQLEPSSLHAYHGDQLGAPRDYRLNSGGYFYTAEGVRRVLKLRGLSDRVRVIELTTPPVTGKFKAIEHLLAKREPHGLD